ncbi:PKD domain-containing protein [Archangium primigenium]|uniref:PKD domain-containing protein n=1 Tax=[Archangium] primigenium TaxID=2792470 RepID=UPI00195CEB3A|nr:PKD domain-containing protein [Archangium primigenium]MBM7114789.1 PKD domain-containing protein [Archangium primigenium]
MTSSARARVVTATLLVTAALWGSGCRKGVRPEAGEDRTVEAGVPVTFGSAAADAPTVTWDFGDGSPRVQGTRVTHAFPRRGDYTVQALEGDASQASARLTVVPRPVLRAIPAEAEVAVFVPQLRDNVDPVMGFVSRLLGEPQVMRGLDAVPLLSLVLREATGEARLVDPEEGLGFFSLPDFEGSVVLLGVQDVQGARDAVVKELSARGASVVRQEPEGSVLLRRDNGALLLLFADRGYLYLVVPDVPTVEGSGEGAEEGRIQKTLAGPPVDMPLEPVRLRIQGFQDAGLSEQPLLVTMRQRVAAGNVLVYARPVGDDAAEGFQGAWAALRFQEGQAELEGWVESTQSLGGAEAPAPRLLEQAPLDPIAALTLSLPPETLTKLVFGAPGSEQRARMTRGLGAQGLDAASVDGLLGALRGDVSLLAYLDAAAFYRNFLTGSQKPEPRGSLLVQAGLVRSEPVLKWLTGVLESRRQPFQVVKDKAGTRLTTRLMNQPVEFSLTEDRLTVLGGEPLGLRPQGAVGAALRERFGAAGFESGHLTAMVDMGRVLSELQAPKDVPGVPPQQLSMVQTMAATLLEQLPPVDSLFLDFAAEPGGGRFRLRAALRSR